MANKLDNKIRQIFIFSGEQKVFSYLLDQNDWQTAKEIQEKTCLSKATINFALNKLFTFSLVERIQKGKTYLYKVNSSYPLIPVSRQYKILNNVIDCLPLVNKLKPLCEKIVLFGSLSRGENNNQSDIDLLVVTHNQKDVTKLTFSKRKIQIIAKSPIALIELEKKDPVFFKEIEQGIILWEKDYGE